jgi:hypothetical protein
MPAHANGMDLTIEIDGNRRRFSVAAIEQGAEG